MKSSRKTHLFNSGVQFSCLLAALLCLMSLAAPVLARDGAVQSGDGLQRYIIHLQDPPLALYDGRELSVPSRSGAESLPATSARLNGQDRLDRGSPQALAYLKFIASRQEELRAEAAVLLHRQISVPFTYFLATNGMAMDLTPGEAAILAESPLVKSIRPERKYRLDTYAGPPWIGAGGLWSGESGFQSQGENIIIANIDTGINWDHVSFADPSPDGYSYSNPRGQQLGLCVDETVEIEVNCNNKLIGVYDFVFDSPSTPDVVEENTNGLDNDGHGSHTVSIAAGNKVNYPVGNGKFADLSGVAPRANIISYRVCFNGDPDTTDDDGCLESFTRAAVEQAIADEVHVINYSVGSGARDPWRLFSDTDAFLAAREAGIFVTTSAGNSGPGEETIGSPANAPWIMAVGSATHDIIEGSAVQDLQGGDTTPPGDLVGKSLNDGIGLTPIVYAGDYDHPLCGIGDVEFGETCDDNTGLTNPWAGERPFEGKIVVCDRGVYGRVEMSKNVMLAGAVGYILANTETSLQTTVAAEHCLPSSHIDLEDGNALRAWLASGEGHQGSISGFELLSDPQAADRVSSFSARGPALSPVENTLKPNVFAPGSSILGAIHTGQAFGFKSGTSMSSPHVAGAAALLMSVHGDWSPSQVASAIETTATVELAKDFDGSTVDPHQSGAGRTRIDEAVNAGLFLEVSAEEFQAANPGFGGDPGQLNLPGLVNASCLGSCQFTRTVTDQMGGGSWTATAEGFPENVVATVSPATFVLDNGGSRELEIEIDVSGHKVDRWVFGNIVLNATGSPEQMLTAAVYVPPVIVIEDDRNGGWQDIELSGMTALPDATFTSAGFTETTRTVRTLSQDPTNDDPFDSDAGTVTVWHELPEGGLWLHAETLASSAPDIDIDLFVGRDSNENGQPDPLEVMCESTTPEDIESCNLFDLQPGNYWVRAQVWDGGADPRPDDVNIVSAAAGPTEENAMTATGPGMVAEGEPFNLRISWDNLNALPGEELLGAVAIGSNRETPNNVQLVQITFKRNGIAEPQTFPLPDGRTRRLAIDANSKHDRIFIDIPPGTASLTVTASGADEAQSEALSLDLVHLSFNNGLSDPPFATPAGNATVRASHPGGDVAGPSVAFSGNSVPSGRWYAVLRNDGDSAASVSIRADVESQGSAIPMHPGLWEPISRRGLGQGYEYNQGGDSRALIWYTYGTDGQPEWFIAGNKASQGNIWTSDLFRVTNDGQDQQLTPVGVVSVTNLEENEAMFSFTLFGESGTDKMQALSDLKCPDIDGEKPSYTGIWYKGSDGTGGASVLVNDERQAQIHYLFDAAGMPRWLFAQNEENPEPTHNELPMLQFRGYCAVCDPGEVSALDEPSGVMTRSFSSETEGNWRLTYMLQEPLEGAREDSEAGEGIVKLTDTFACQ